MFDDICVDLESQEKLMKQLREDANDRLLRRDLDRKIQKVRNKRKQVEDLYRTEKEKIVDVIFFLLLLVLSVNFLLLPKFASGNVI